METATAVVPQALPTSANGMPPERSATDRLPPPANAGAMPMAGTAAPNATTVPTTTAARAERGSSSIARQPAAVAAAAVPDAAKAAAPEGRQAMVDAALRWVAGSTRDSLDTAGKPAGLVGVPPAPAQDIGTTAFDMPASTAPPALPVRTASTETVVRTDRQAWAPEAPVRTSPLDRPQARDVDAADAPAAQPAATARKEAIEVSIGAIHLRVDAPPAAPTAAARPALPVPPTAAARPAAAAARSSLARRALRRV